MATELKNYGTNIYTAPNGLIRRTVYHGNTRLIKELFTHAQTVCRNQISEQYIAHVLNPDKKNFSKGYAYFLEDELIGFVVWTIKDLNKLKMNIIRKTNTINPGMPSKILYIDLLCAKETGTTLGYKMLDDAENYCIENAIPFIDLEASNSKLFPYYEQFGFARNSFRNNIMSKPIVTLIKSTPMNYKTRKTRKASHTSQFKSKISEQDKIAIEKYLEELPKITENIKNTEKLWKVIKENNKFK